MSSVLLGGVPAGDGADQVTQAIPAVTPPPPPGAPGAPGAPASPSAPQRANTVTVLAGVGVLLLAMGVGVLIGRSGGSKAAPAAPQVITVAGSGADSAGTATPTPFTDDWPAGTSGYTVQLQTLPQATTQVSAVVAAKAAATAKGAKGVGALKSEDFSSLTSGNYVIYAGIDHTKAQAEKALGGLKKSFPGATVVRVSNGSSTAGSGGSGSGGSGAGSSESHPAPPTVLNNLRKSGGGSYEQKSKNLPDVIETG
jgi:hypothetical protein